MTDKNGAAERKKNISTALEKLLRAALNSGAESINAFREWSDATDFEKISFAEYQLLPLVYRRLQLEKFTDARLPKMKGICRRVWLENQLRKPQIAAIFTALNDAGIEFIFLNNAPPIHSMGGDEGVFSFSEIEIQLRRRQLAKALPALEKIAWKAAKNPGGRFSKDESAWLEHHKYQGISLRWKSWLFTEDVWDHAETATVAGKEVKIPGSADYLLQLCGNEFLTEKCENGVWILYTALLLQSRPKIDWERLAKRSRRLKLHYALAEMLDFVREFTRIDLPSEFTRQLVYQPPGRLRTLISAFNSLRQSYRETRRNNPSAASAFGFARFLQNHWHADSVFELPRQIGKKIRNLPRR